MRAAQSQTAGKITHFKRPFAMRRILAVPRLSAKEISSGSPGK
jgi:hypothetical protein